MACKPLWIPTWKAPPSRAEPSACSSERRQRHCCSGSQCTDHSVVGRRAYFARAHILVHNSAQISPSGTAMASVLSSQPSAARLRAIWPGSIQQRRDCIRMHGSPLSNRASYTSPRCAATPHIKFARSQSVAVHAQADAAGEPAPESAPVAVPDADMEEAAKKLRIAGYFALWWFLNVVFNIYNKKVLNAFPFPWLCSTLALAAGVAIMLLSWATRLVEYPKTDLDFWKALFPVSIASPPREVVVADPVGC